MRKTYSELISIPDFKDRILYLRTNSKVGLETFGGSRWLNQTFYTSIEWKRARRNAIIRDSYGGFIHDLSHPDHEVIGYVYVHHIEPITVDDIRYCRPVIYELENLVCTSFSTHNMIHYGIDSDIIDRDFFCRERDLNDTCLWRLNN